jgi:AraC-like DNA-binding protein
MDERFMHRMMEPGDLATVKKLPADEPGILESSTMYLHLPSEFTREALFYAPYIGAFRCDKHYAVRRNNYDYYLSLLVDSGTLFVSSEGKDYRVEPRNLLLLDCKKPHLYRAKGDVSFRFFHFDGSSSARIYDRIVSVQGPVIRTYDQVIIENAYNAILALANDGCQNEFKISAQIYLILSELLSRRQSSNSLHSRMISRSICFMENYFTDDISVGQIAASACYSEYHFSRLFKKYMRISPHAYLQNLRIVFARQLLSAAAMTVEAVSEKCGFNSVQHFIRCFKQHTGVTPNHYRKTTACM